MLNSVIKHFIFFQFSIFVKFCNSSCGRGGGGLHREPSLEMADSAGSGGGRASNGWGDSGIGLCRVRLV
jgi:hypothetical protein